MVSIKSKTLSCKHHYFFSPAKAKPIGLHTAGIYHDLSSECKSTKNLMWYESLNTYYWFKGMKKALCGSDHDFHLILLHLFSWFLSGFNIEQIGQVPFFQSSTSVFLCVFVLGSLAVNVYHKFPHPVIKWMPCTRERDGNFHQSFPWNKTSVFLLPSGVFLAITSWRRKCKELCSNHNASSFHYSCYAEGLESFIYIPGGAMASVLFNTLE